MRECYQFTNQNILEHGHSVLSYYDDLLNYIRGNESLKEWRMPEWINSIKEEDLIDYEIVRDYLIYHDCGKPFCRTVDDEGKQHFYNHAEISYNRWLRYSDNKQIANLIRSDMDIHTLPIGCVDEFKKRPEAITLLLSALCEIHSNSTAADPLAGIESTSFKIKWKRINQIGKRLMA